MDFCKILIHYYSNNLFALHQCLLLSELLINCDETGRLKLLESLQEILLEPSLTLAPVPNSEELEE